MKKILYLTVILSVMTGFIFGQTNSSSSKITGDVPVKSFQNKDIMLGNLQSDSITPEQIKGCNTITLRTDPNREILKYTLILMVTRADCNDMYEYHGSGDQIPDNILKQIITSGATKIFFENVQVRDESGVKNIGYRGYLIKV